MDHERFDALARMLATTGSRRTALGALLGAGLLGQTLDALAKPGKGKGKRRGKEGGDDRGKGRKRRTKRGRKDTDGGKDPEPLAGPCCGDARQCAPPERGSTRSGCDFAERSFACENHTGSIFRGIDGRDSNFDDTDNHGSVFAEACLRRASFRGANLEGTTWGGACLFGTNFTGAELGGDSAVFAGAIFCATIMPDGTRNDRDCGRSSSSPCCLPPPGGGGVGSPRCTEAAECPDEPSCRAKECLNGRCVYDGCSCNPRSCRDGCCSEDNICQPGNTVQSCGAGIFRCMSCSEDQTCQDGQCVDCQQNCTCAGQSACRFPAAFNARCGLNGDCFCVVSRAGQPFCAGDPPAPVIEGCATDADCQARIPGSVCVNSGRGRCRFSASTFCAPPCPF